MFATLTSRGFLATYGLVGTGMAVRAWRNQKVATLTEQTLRLREEAKVTEMEAELAKVRESLRVCLAVQAELTAVREAEKGGREAVATELTTGFLLGGGVTAIGCLVAMLGSLAFRH